MKPEFYIPRDVHTQILSPYQGAWSLSLHTVRVPEVVESSKIIFTSVDRGPHMGKTFTHMAKQGYMGFQLPDRRVMLVKESDISFDIPENFDELQAEAEDELEEELAELGYNPFR